jgi:WD40 repeat protein
MLPRRAPRQLRGGRAPRRVAGAGAHAHADDAAGMDCFVVEETPTDGIAALAFGAGDHADWLLSCGWDCTVRCHDAATMKTAWRAPCRAPVLDVAFGPHPSDASCVFGGLDRRLHLYDPEARTDTLVGHHPEPVRKVAVAPAHGAHSHGGGRGLGGGGGGEGKGREV